MDKGELQAQKPRMLISCRVLRLHRFTCQRWLIALCSAEYSMRALSIHVPCANTLYSGLQLMEAHARATRLPHKLSASPPVGPPQPEDTLDSPEGACLWSMSSSVLPKDRTGVLQICMRPCADMWATL